MTDHRICFVGDSFVQGTGDPHCLGWTGRVSAAARRKGIDLTAYNLGVRRDTSADVLARWRGECAPRLPAESERYAVFSFGVNDTTAEGGALRVPQAQSLENLKRILHEARRDYRVLFVGPPPVADAEQNERIGALSESFTAAASELGVPCLPVFETLRADPVWMEETAAADGAHPGAAGYERLAALVSQWEKWWF